MEIVLLDAVSLSGAGCGHIQAKSRGTPRYFTDPLGIRFVYIPGGTFNMGHAGPEGPVRRVELTGFWMGEFEVKNAELDMLRKRPRPPESTKDDQPAGSIDYNLAMEYIGFLHRKTGLEYALPTDAQWEYAARGGLEGADYPWGDEAPDGRAQLRVLGTAPVGSFKPNAYGLYDMSGNVDEIVKETYYDYSAVHLPVRDPVGPLPTSKHYFWIVRGGSYAMQEGEVWLRVPCTLPVDPGNGMRLVLLAPPAIGRNSSVMRSPR